MGVQDGTVQCYKGVIAVLISLLMTCSTEQSRIAMSRPALPDISDAEAVKSEVYGIEAISCPDD